MNRLNFSSGVLTALLISLGGAALLPAFALVLGLSLALRCVLLLMMLAYWIWLLRVTAARAGISLMAAGWLMLSAVLVLFNPPFLIWLAACTFLIWLQRSALRYHRPAQALADAALNLLSFCAAVATYIHTDSFLLSCWSFFLLQAGCAFIPAAEKTTPNHPIEDDRFAQARHSAEQALRRLRQSSSI